MNAVDNPSNNVTQLVRRVALDRLVNANPKDVHDQMLNDTFGEILNLMERGDALSKLIPEVAGDALREIRSAVASAVIQIDQIVGQHSAVTVAAADQIHQVSIEGGKIQAKIICTIERGMADYQRMVETTADDKWKRRLATLATVALVSVVLATMAGTAVLCLHYKEILVPEQVIRKATK